MNSLTNTTVSKPVPTTDLNASLKFDPTVELAEPSALEKANVLTFRLGIIFTVLLIAVVVVLFYKFLFMFVLH